ncbi:MAG: hypothetical protein KGJ34_02585 [Patescibacteria group bacterium]|nr:hypothetical protein [Patescibacteria group bacterium]
MKAGRNIWLSIFLALIIIFLAAYAAYVERQGDTPAAQNFEEYTNTTYGFTFEYPQANTIESTSPQYVAVGEGSGSAFSAQVAVNVITSDASEHYASFEQFAFAQGELQCDADGPTGSVRCPSIASSTPFQSSTGLSGELFYLNQVTTTSTTTERSIKGPFIAYNLSKSASGSPYSGVLIFVPGSISLNEELVAIVAGSVQLQNP